MHIATMTTVHTMQAHISHDVGDGHHVCNTKEIINTSFASKVFKCLTTCVGVSRYAYFCVILIVQ